MFVEFSVSNYRSIGDKVTFSAVAGISSSKKDTLSFVTNNSYAPRALKSAVLFGPNGSGKSSLISAISYFSSLIVYSSKQFSEGDKFYVPTNKLDPKFKGSPTEFEIIFIHENELFQYGFSLCEDRIMEEWLFAKHSKPSSRLREIFYRVFDPDSNGFEWQINEAQLPGEREVWKKSTRENALFLATAVQLNSETLKKPFEWIRDKLAVIKANERIDHKFTAKLINDPTKSEQVSDLIRMLDLKIERFRVEEKPAEVPSGAEDLFAPKLIEKLQKEVEDRLEYELFIEHKNALGEPFELEFDDESDGTQAIIGLAGPLIDVLDSGMTIFIDELHNSLHPLALKALVNIFHDCNVNKNNAQLFFTSHETSILSKGFMHQDQIWFIDRPNGFSTELKPMSDFDVRGSEAFQRSYLGGKFGALPNIRGINFGL